MRRIKTIIFFSLAFLLTCLISCKRETEEFVTDQVSDYIPAIVGKYITYRIDSTVFTNLGRNTEVHSYQVKHVVDAQVTDNLGRPAFRIFRFLRDVAGTQPWTPNGTYFITPLFDQIEVTEDNLRFIKLHLPLKTNASWKGNKYLSADPYASLYTFSNDDNMGFWDYAIAGTGESQLINGVTVNDILTVNHADDSTLVDTFSVVTGNIVQIPSGKTSAWVNGNSTGTITVNISSPANGAEIRIYNASNNILRLNGIGTPPNYSRNYQYQNNQWGFGGGKDTLFTDLPYGSKTFSTEKYSKNIGLVSRDYIIWEFQPNIGGASGGYKVGFGIKMRMIDHN